MAPKEIKPSPPVPWFVERRHTVWLLIFLFMLITAVSIFMGRQHYVHIKENQLLDDRVAAKLYALLLEERLGRIIKTMESYAYRPLLIQAVKEKNVRSVQSHLRDLSRHNPGSESLVVTDPQGTLWASQSHLPDVTGKNFAHRDWYIGVSKNWKTYISNARLRLAGEKDAAIYIAVPVFDNRGVVSGILVNAQRTVSLGQPLQRIPKKEGRIVNICDRNGVLLFSTRHPYVQTLISYPLFPYRTTGSEKTALVSSPYEGGKKRFLSYAPVSDVGWSVFVERDGASFLTLSAPYIISLAVISILLFLTMTMFMLYFRRRIITESKLHKLRMETELAASEIRFRELFDHMSTGVAIYDVVQDGKDFIFSDMNLAGKRITGVSESFVGKSVRDVFPNVEAFGLFAILQKVWKTGQEYRHPSSLYQDGKLAFWADNYIYKLPSGHIVAMFDDITERKKAEQTLIENENKLREAQEMAHLGFWRWNIQTGMVEWSDEVFKIFGQNPKAFHPDIDAIMDLSPWPEDRQRAGELINRAKNNHAPGFYEQKFLRPDQTIGYYYSTFQGQYDENGRLFSIVGTVLDITERKQTEERINKLNTELEIKVKERTAEIAAKNAELERLNRVFVDRELRMRELKAQIAQSETP